jgi:serine/threonine kinase 16
MLQLFHGTCLAVRAMHDHREAPSSMHLTSTSVTSDQSPSRAQQQHGEDEEDADSRFPQPEGDAEGGYSYAATPQMTSMARERPQEIVFDGDEEEMHLNGHVEGGDEAKTELVPYAHRDLKPGFDQQILLLHKWRY